MTLITAPEPAFALARLILRRPDAHPALHATLAADILAQSPEWTDVALAREARTGFWSTPQSEHGNNFNRRRDLEARPMVMECDEFLPGALEFPPMDSRMIARRILLALAVGAGIALAALFAGKAIANAAHAAVWADVLIETRGAE